MRVKVENDTLILWKVDEFEIAEAPHGVIDKTGNMYWYTNLDLTMHLFRDAKRRTSSFNLRDSFFTFASRLSLKYSPCKRRTSQR